MSCFEKGFHPTKECYETVLQTMAEAVFIIDLKGVIKFCNKAVKNLIGYEPEELLGKTFDELELGIQPAHIASIVQAGKTIDNEELTLKHKEGRDIPVSRNARIMRNMDRDAIGVVETFRDLSTLKAVEKKLERLKNKQKLETSFQNMVGRSQPMQNVFELIKMSSSSNASILITGDTGTGKELAARAIHNESYRKKRALVTVNCSALPENLLESELFGHVKGAFTGAIKDKKGRFELADQGTLFLDEISEISPLIQLKLLRFLQEKEFERVGESITRQSDVRVISATNKDLWQMVQNGMFREDLYYRLKVFPIQIPPLKERKKDVGFLIEHFIERFNIETGRNIKGLSSEAALSLMEYQWPGNVRELENAIEHAFVIRREGLIELLDLPIEIRKTPITDPKIMQSEDPISTAQTRSKPPLDKESLTQLLIEFHWNKSALAKHLNINRTTVWRMMKRFKIAEKAP